MSYLDDDLLPDERVVYRASLHPIIFARALVVMVVGIVGFIVVPAVPALGAALLLAGVLMRVPPFIPTGPPSSGSPASARSSRRGVIRRRTKGA